MEYAENTVPIATDISLDPAAALAGRPPDLVGLFSGSRWSRRTAAERLSLQTLAARYALRQVLWHDPDATVRAAAATRLGRCPDAAVADVARWLCDSAGDSSPAVREASLRSLTRLEVKRGQWLHLPDDVKADVLGANAARVFGL